MMSPCRLPLSGPVSVARFFGQAFAAAGHQVTLGTRDPEQTRAREEWAGVDLPLAAYADLQGEVFLNATSGDGSLAALQAVGPALHGKVVIDASNPLDHSRGFPPSLFVSNTDSLAEQLQQALPEVRLVKMFNTMAHEVMVDPAGLGQESTIFLAGNDAAARQAAADLAPRARLDRRAGPRRPHRRPRAGDVHPAMAAHLRRGRPAPLQHQGRPLTPAAPAWGCA